ncbi:hypothetical protein I5M27_03105 [Adhaeribacter sp. BT258]|uniref:Antitoxin component YwqK of the YwqJK toxin-antitoxin module n=1 Tax=Adhaeribacter terrigena TaxID=2793070 RepID=A0ABS1BXS9_9BACT|nr:hypothetical protein [Adhaeribacter terrigena]MBK0401956.1 hypothetical protein [Adhaeribacter terrigena]
MINSGFIKFLYCLVALLAAGFSAHGQNLPDSFKIGKYVEVLNGDSLKVHFNCAGQVVPAGCASYYRVGRIDREYINFKGLVRDYFGDGKLAFVGEIQNNNLNGKAVYYYKNGNISETGFYRDHVREGIWKYFYSDGKLEKVINFINSEPFVVTYLDSNNVAQVINGNGNFLGTFVFNGCHLYQMRGTLKEGKMHGEWTMYNTVFRFGKSDGIELFENGKFIKGYSERRKSIPNDYSNYTDRARITFNSPYPAENLNLAESFFTPCLKDAKGQLIRTAILHDVRYNQKRLEASFYPELQEKLQASLAKDVTNQWLIVGLNVEKSDAVSEISVLSSINDVVLENSLHAQLKQMNLWNSARVNKVRFGYSHFFTILIHDKQVLIPKLILSQARENNEILLRLRE